MSFKDSLSLSTSSSDSDLSSRSRSQSSTSGVALVQVPLVGSEGKTLHYFYLDGGSISVFYVADLIAYLDVKELSNVEKVAKFLNDSPQLEIVELPLYFPDGRALPQDRHIFVTVDGLIRLACLHGSVDKQRRLLWTMRPYIEESFASFSSTFLSQSEVSSSSSSPEWVDSSGDEELIAAFRKGVEVKDRKYHLKTYPQCFIGTEAIDWLVNHHWANTREEAAEVGNRLLQKGVFQHVAKEHDFRDKYYFYRFLEPVKRTEVNERFKVVILGPSYSGKTSLFSLLPQKSLKKDRSKRTVLAQGEVIQRAGWQSTLQRMLPAGDASLNAESIDENIQITLWDFASHPEADADRSRFEPMHRGFHRLFFTSVRTLFIITVNLSTFNASEMDYWIQNIHDYAPGTPVVVVGTHQDAVTAQRVSAIEMFVKDRYRRFKLIKEFFPVSCTSLKNISKLKGLITHFAHEALNKLPGASAPLAARIQDLDAKLKFEEAIYQLRRKGRSTMTMTELTSLARATMPEASPEDIQSAISFVAALGACIVFPQALCQKIKRVGQFSASEGSPKTRLLQELVIINPNWLLKLLVPVKLSFLKKKSATLGVIKLSQLRKCWAQEEIDPSLYDDLFDLLVHFKIIYSLPSLVAQAETIASAQKASRESASEDFAPFAPKNHLLAIPMLFPLWTALERSESGDSLNSSGKSASAMSLAARGRRDSIFDPLSPRSRSRSALANSVVPSSLVRYFVFPGLMPWFLMELVTIQLYIGTVLSTNAQAAIGQMQFDMFSGGNRLRVSGANESRSEMRILSGPTNEAAIVWIIHGPSVLGHTRFLTDSFNHLMQGEFSNVKYDILTPCGCSGCSAKTLALHSSKSDNSALNDNVYSLSELEEIYAHGITTVQCTVSDAPVAIESMAPEVALADMRMIQVDFDRIQREKMVAQGGFGKVFRAKLGDATVAVKEIICTDETEAGLAYREFRRECWIMAIVSQNPYVVSLKGFSIKKTSNNSSSHQDPVSFCLVMDFISHGNLHSYLMKTDAQISWRMRLKIARDVAMGMVFLHGCQVLHHDLKSLNVFIASTNPDDDVVAKVGDFGEARISFSYSKRDNVSNPTWLAPEVLENQPFSKKSDVYSFGITLFELASRELPFAEYPVANSPFVFELEASIKAGLRPNMKRLVQETAPFDWNSTENKCPPAWEQLYLRCVDEMPIKRPDFIEILQILDNMMN